MRIQARGIGRAVSKIDAVAARLLDLTPVMRVVGEMMVAEAQSSFRSQSSPDGKPWPALSGVTVYRRIARKGGRAGVSYSNRRVFKRGGGLTARASKALAPGGIAMLRDRGRLFGSLSSKASPRSLKFGADVVYARAQHEGNPDNKMFGKRPAPIPARRFLPVIGGGKGGRASKMTGGRADALWAESARLLRRFVLTGVVG